MRSERGEGPLDLYEEREQMAADYYEVLGVERDVDARALKRAYRKLAMQYHPDRNQGDSEAEAKFKEISEAYEVLSDDEKRTIYDRFGHEGLQGQGFGGFRESNVEDIFSHFGDIFGDLFGGGRRGRPKRGADLRYNLAVTLEECLERQEKSIKIPYREPCDTCDGSGAAKGTQPVTCSTCGGVGKVNVGRGFISMVTTCPHCEGRGKVIKKPCKKCKGSGLQERVEELTVQIPAGVDDGMRLRLSGKGELDPRGGERGDLYVAIHVEEHDRFRREGDALIAELEVDMVQAALGATIDFDGLDGPLEISLPSGSQPDDIIKVPRKGMSQLNGRGARGDLFLQLRVQVPKRLSKKQRAHLEEFRKLS